MADEAVRAATGRDWAEWRAALDATGAAAMPHPAIVRLVADHGTTGWWSQMVTVGYERMIGRRVIGQRCAGDYAASASRTMPCDMDTAMARWRALADGRIEFAGALAESEPRASTTPKWRYWRVDLDNGSHVTVMASAKPDGRALLAVNHEKLADGRAASAAKAFWKGLLAEA
jgi:hypothetical protein